MYVYNVTLSRVRATSAAVKKTISASHSECMFVASVIQHAMHMRHNVICDLPGSTVFSQISHKWYHFFFMIKLLYIKCVYLLISTNLMHKICFTISLFHASTCFEHMRSSSGGQNCIIQPLVSSH